VSTVGEDPADTSTTTAEERRATRRLHVVLAINIATASVTVGVAAAGDHVPGSALAHGALITALAVATLASWIGHIVARATARRDDRFDDLEKMFARVAGDVRLNARRLDDIEALLIAQLDQLHVNTGDLATARHERSDRDRDLLVAALQDQVAKLSDRLDASDFDRDQLVASVLDVLKLVQQVERVEGEQDQ